MAYSGSIDLISGIRAKNNGTFPLVDAKDVYVNDEYRLDAYLAQLGGGGILETTWAALKTKKDAGELSPGQQYRITDYVATTGVGTATSANHPFDLIVTADATNKLNEVARAVRHEGDTYFPDSTKLEAWKVWYCIDNDTSRFNWAKPITITISGNEYTRYEYSDVAGADHPYYWWSNSAIKGMFTDSELPAVNDSAYETSDGTTASAITAVSRGRGVIYRLVDEFGNDAPFDFKGLKFKAYGMDANDRYFAFDSNDSNHTDYSIGGHYIHDNIIGASNSGELPNIVLLGASNYCNMFDANCYGITLRKATWNKIGYYCHSIKSVGDKYLTNNIITGSNITFTVGASSVSIAGSYITFSQECIFSTIEKRCVYLTIGTDDGDGVAANLEIKCGVMGTQQTYKAITVPKGSLILRTFKPVNAEVIEI